MQLPTLLARRLQPTVLSGQARDVDLEKASITFSVNGHIVTMDIPGGMRQPFGSGAYVAVAVRRNWFVPSEYVGTAFRIGSDGSVRAAGRWSDAFMFMLGLTGIVVTSLFTPHEAPAWVPYMALAVFVYGGYRLIEISRGVRLLRRNTQINPNHVENR